MDIKDAKNYFEIDMYDGAPWLRDVSKTEFDTFVEQIYRDHNMNIQFKDAIIKRQKEKVNLSRKICAMLFWEWRKAERESDEKGDSPEFSDGDYWYLKAKEEAFRQAHKMVKAI